MIDEDGRMHITRISTKKSWIKSYDSRRSDLLSEKEEGRVPEERRNLATTIAMGSIIAKRLGKKVRRRLHTKKYSCHRTIDNLHESPAPAAWKAVMGTQVVCDVCGVVALNDSVACVTCNAVAHRLCVGLVTKNLRGADKEEAKTGGELKEVSDEESGSSSDDESDGAMEGNGINSVVSKVSLLQTVGADDFQCINCRHDIKNDEEFFDRLHGKLAESRRFVLAVRVVARKILAYVERHRFKKLRKGLILIQSCIRRRRAKRWLFFLRRNAIRVVILNFMDLPPGLLRTDIVCITCVDTMKHGQQIFRFDKTVEAIEAKEAFFVPGISALMTIVISILRLDEHSAGTVYYNLCQTQLSVRDGDYTEKRPYNLSLSKNITWAPVDTRGDYHYHIEKIKAPAKKKASATEDAANSVDVKGGGGLDGVSRGRSGSALIATADAKAESKGLAHTTSPHKGELAEAKPTASGSGVVAERKLSPMEVLSEQSAALNGQKIRMYYRPLNPISSVCLLASGPPLEDLRKPAETDLRLLALKKVEDTAKLKSMVEGRTTLWWLVCSRLKLYFFQYHGDPKPRLVADVAHANVEIDPQYMHRCVVKIRHADKREWLLEFEDFKKALKFEFAVNESQAASKTEGGSMFMTTSDLKQRFQYGHGVHIY